MAVRPFSRIVTRRGNLCFLSQALLFQCNYLSIWSAPPGIRRGAYPRLAGEYCWCNSTIPPGTHRSTAAPPPPRRHHPPLLENGTLWQWAFYSDSETQQRRSVPPRMQTSSSSPDALIFQQNPDATIEKCQLPQTLTQHIVVEHNVGEGFGVRA